MAIPSRLLGSGLPAQAAINIVGDVGNTLTAAGTVQGDALALSAAINNITTAAASTGVRLPPCEAGAQVYIRNGGASTINIFPATGGTINGGAANAAITLATTKAALLIGLSDTAWVSLPGA